MNALYVAGAVVVGVVLFILFGVWLLTKWYRKVDQGRALIVNTLGAEPDVTFTGRHVLPIFHRAEVMDISVKTIEIDRHGKGGLICKDNIRADIKVTFFVRVNKTAEDVLKVAQAIGCARASDQGTLEELFSAKFSEALKTVGKQLDFVDLYTRREEFKDQIIDVIGRDLNGYVLEDAAIDYLEQTPVSSLDPNNILDAQGIRKITELTAREHVQTNLFENQEKKQVKKQDVETAEAILQLDRQQADAEARQHREIANIRAREAAEVAKVEAEERLRAEMAKLKAAEELEIQAQSKQRQVEVAEKNRERVVGIETERVDKDRQLEAISREREVELQRIAKEKSLEVERKNISEVIRERVSVEKAVAEEEEAIKTLREVEEAKRQKEATIIAAEGEAQESLVKQIKQAEAAEQASKFRAREKLVLAEAELEAADKNAQAKVRLAEGVQAEEAASGLAQVRVKEADALALEKMGFAEAKIALEKAQAAAKGREAEAEAIEKLGLAEAKVAFEKAQADAQGKEAQAGAIQKVGSAEAEVLRQRGAAEATAVQDKLTAEAAGLAEKAKSMKALDEAGRDHEEFRLRLEKDKEVEMAAIRVRQAMAEAQAMALAEAFKSANIDIVGGDGQFFDRVMNAVAMGKTVDGFVDHSDTAQAALRDYLKGGRSLPADLTEVLGSFGSGDAANLTLAVLLGKLASGASGDDASRLQELLDTAKRLGVSNTRLSS